MKFLKKIFKAICLIAALAIIGLVVVLLGESYETVDRITKGAITKVEVKRLFGKKLSEASLNSQGLYDAEFQNWHLFKKNMIRSEGQFKNGLWHGKWKDYNRVTTAAGNKSKSHEIWLGDLFKI